MRLLVGAATDTGRVRRQNEDVYELRADKGLFIVCDGMGGASAGEVASDLAAKSILEALNGSRADGAGPPDAERGCLPRTSRLAEAVRRSNQVIYDQAQREPQHAGMGTTVVSAWIAQSVASIAHVGDSRAYLWRQGELTPLTRDHSLVEAQVQAGMLDRDASRTAEHQNVLLRVLGREPEVDVELNEVPVQPGDYLLLCSDGLTRMVTDTTMADAILLCRDPQRICDFLIDQANGNGGADNITVVVVKVDRHWWERLADAWAWTRRGHDAETHPAV
jgi:protein phosphatase